MNSIFVLNKTNFDFFKTGKMDAPYWEIQGRVCYHYGEDPVYVKHNGMVDGSLKHKYDDYYHVDKKLLYCISRYKVADLVDIATRLHLPHGTKVEMYKTISEYLKN
jgi:hypothetical protein